MDQWTSHLCLYLDSCGGLGIVEGLIYSCFQEFRVVIIRFVLIKPDGWLGNLS